MDEKLAPERLVRHELAHALVGTLSGLSVKAGVGTAAAV
jgi:hypothetical protein